MRSRSRHFGGQRIAAARSATIDLFAATSAPERASPPASTPALSAVSPASPMPRPRPKQLWYAAVFPELPEAQAATVLQRLSRSAQRFTSLVSIEMPNALLLEVKGSVRLFGSLAALHADIDAVWRRPAPGVRTTVAPTTVGALWLARAGRRLCIEETGALAGALAEVPIVCTGWSPDRLQTLRSLGVNRIGELLRLPRAGLARRLGPDAVLDLDVALARQPAPRRAFVPRERFRERCDFETEIETVGYLQKAVEPLIVRCVRFLRERQAGVQALQLTLRHRAIRDTRVCVGLAGITGERRRLSDVLGEKLQRLALPAPVKGMELASGSLQPLSACSLDAFAGANGGGRDTAPQLVERLRARLGEEAVYGVASIAEHRPEAAWQRVHALRLHAARSHAASLAERYPGGGMPRPVWLLSEPLVFSSQELQQLRRGHLVLEEGPERIESGWWDGKGVARDYYVARQAHGARWWIFQERQTKGWYLHGVFA